VCPGVASAQGQAAKIDLGPVAEAPVRELGVPRGGGEHLRALRGQLATPGDEIGMQVGLRHVGQAQPAIGGRGQVRGRITLGVDHERPPVAQVDEIGGVAEPPVDDRGDQASTHRGPLRCTLSPAWQRARAIVK
jgi:hypothetical protein